MELYICPVDKMTFRLSDNEDVERATFLPHELLAAVQDALSDVLREDGDVPAQKEARAMIARLRGLGASIVGAADQAVQAIAAAPLG